LQMHGGSTSCRSLRRTTWAHAPVDPGAARCDEATIGIISDRRMWHSQGASDAVACNSSVPANVDPTMPGGWLLVRSYAGQASVYTTTGSGSSCAGYDATLIERVFWKTAPSGAPMYVCRFRQYSGGPGTETPQGWFSTLPFTPQSGAGAPRAPYLELHPIDYGALLERYRPQLRYHSAESYRADSAWTATLPLPPFSGDPDRSNNLERENGAILAAADSLLGYPPLSLDSLPPRAATAAELYASGEPALDSDRIDFRDDSSQIDAADMHANTSLANKIYARATHGADGKLWLQYWFFYYYNSAFLGAADHEADWELIQIGLRGDLMPDVATYAQHAGAERCNWDRVPKYDGPAGIGPVVFVALGSHASLFDPQVGTYDPPASERVRPEIEQQIGNAAPGWATWRGLWGGSNFTIHSPGYQGLKWDDPTGFNSDAADGCPTEASGAVTARHGARLGVRAPRTTKVPAPRLSAKRSGSHAVIRYRFSRRQWKRLPRRAGLVLAVRGSNKGSLPSNTMFRLRHRAGRRRLRLPRSPGPYVVMGQTLTRSGPQSRLVTIPLR
jgi:hypothetical protein